MFYNQTSLNVTNIKFKLHNFLKSKNSESENNNFIKNEIVSPFSYFIIFITAVVSISICSKSSPIYPFNDWVDANCFFTVGKSIANGKVLYKDIYEQKGPILYFLHTLFYFISPKTILGAYIFEIISCFSFLLISYRTMLLFFSRKIIVAIPLLSAVIYTSPSFSHGGSAEEYCLPLLALCFYIGLKSCISQTSISRKSWLSIGISSALVLWIKFSLVGIYIGFFLFFLLTVIRKKNVLPFLRNMVFLLMGIILGSLPVIIYFTATKSFSHLFQVYFYNNIFLYSLGSSNPFSAIAEVFGGLYSNFKGIALVLFFSALTLVYFFFKGKKIFLYSLISFSFAIFFIYCGGRHAIYYALPIAIFAPIGTAFPFALAQRIKKKNFSISEKKRTKYALVATYALFCILIIFNFSPNVYLLKYEKEDLPQFQFKKIINQTENPTLLNYGFLDGGFYTVCEIVPNCKYFCGLNIPLDEIKKSQDYFVENGLCDFVVTRDATLDSKISQKYRLVCQSEFPLEKKIRVYYLYEKISE